MIVIDASAVVDVLTDREPGGAVAFEISEHKELWAPELMLVEVTSALRRLTRTGLLKSTEADRAVARLSRFPVTLVGHRPLLADAWACRKSLRISDAFYVACSRRLGLPLLTTDGRLARAVSKGIDVAPHLGTDPAAILEVERDFGRRLHLLGGRSHRQTGPAKRCSARRADA